MHIDLHVHTTYSDGTLTPEQNVKCAAEMGIKAIAIVDHDNTNGLDEAVAAAKNTDVEVIAGVELSAEEMVPGGQEVHVLGYFIEWKKDWFQEKLAVIREARWARAERILKKLKEMGLILKMDDVLQFSNAQSVGRLHVAKALMKSRQAGNITEAFEKYLAQGKPAYEPKLRVTPKEAIEYILKLNGVPVIAHPFFGISKDEMLLQELISYGLAGIEVWHPKHNKSAVEYYRNLADKYKLIPTGGSDSHGPIKGRPLFTGHEKVPKKSLDELRKKAFL